jgi:hypothetical protein
MDDVWAPHSRCPSSSARGPRVHVHLLLRANGTGELVPIRGNRGPLAQQPPHFRPACQLLYRHAAGSSLPHVTRSRAPSRRESRIQPYASLAFGVKTEDHLDSRPRPHPFNLTEPVR